MYNLALACNRIGISDRSASLLVNAVLKDFHIVTKENSSRVVDRSKIRRERKIEDYNFKNVQQKIILKFKDYFLMERRM